MRACGERIIFVPFIDAFGGVERLVLGLSRHLHARGVKHAVLCFRQTVDLAAYADWPLTVREIRARRSPIAEGWALRRSLRGAYACGSGPALVFDLKGAFYAGLFTSSPFFLHLTDPPSLLPLDVSKRAPSVRKVFLPQPEANCTGVLEKIHGELVHRINLRGARRAETVLAMTDTIAAELRALYGVAPQVIRPGVRAAAASDAKGEGGQQRFRMLSVSRLESSKRVDWILRALASLESSGAFLSRHVDWALDVVGEGPQRKSLESLAEELGLSGRTFFRGMVRDEELEELYSGAGLFLMPAVQGYGLPALESLARSVPVILSSESGVAEILHRTPWAETIDDVEGLANAIIALIRRVRLNELQPHTMPQFPTESDWAQRISEVCGWL